MDSSGTFDVDIRSPGMRSRICGPQVEPAPRRVGPANQTARGHQHFVADFGSPSHLPTAVQRSNEAPSLTSEERTLLPIGRTTFAEDGRPCDGVGGMTSRKEELLVQLTPILAAIQLRVLLIQTSASRLHRTLGCPPLPS